MSPRRLVSARCHPCREGEHSACETEWLSGEGEVRCNCACGLVDSVKGVRFLCPFCREGTMNPDDLDAGNCTNCGAPPLAVAGDETREPEEVEASGKVFAVCLAAFVILGLVYGLVALFGPGAAEFLK